MTVKILYLEDELFLGKIVKESLESRGYEVVMESDGSVVLKKFLVSDSEVLRSHDPDSRAGETWLQLRSMR